MSKDKGDKPRGAVRTTRIEISEFLSDDPLSSKRRWIDLSEQCQEVMNWLWQQWEVWHVTHGSPAAIRQWLHATKEWHARNEASLRSKKAASRKTGAPKPKANKEGKPKLAIYGISAEMGLTETNMQPHFSHVNHRTIGLLLNKFKEGVKSRKSASGSLSGWMAILLNREGRPSFTRPVPIPFDSQNARILPPDKDHTTWRLSLRVDRIPREGKPAMSTEEIVELKTHKAVVSQGKIVKLRPLAIASILERIDSGEYAFRGSSVVYDKAKRKWFAHISWRRTVEEHGAGLDINKTAVLRAGDRRPWVLEVDDREYWWCGGDGKHVSAVRERILRQRWERQDNYRYAGSASKGHGRKRACQGWDPKLSQRWRDFVKTCNHVTTRRVVDELVKRGVGRIVYMQPDGDYRDTRFLATAGKIRIETRAMPLADAERLAQGKRRECLGVAVKEVGNGQAVVSWYRNDASGWDWFQVATFLRSKCQEVGIHVEVLKESGEPAPADEVA
jgi:hypothetical protein